MTLQRYPGIVPPVPTKRGKLLPSFLIFAALLTACAVSSMVWVALRAYHSKSLIKAGHRSFAGMEFDVPTGWIGLDSGHQLTLVDMTAITGNSPGHDRTATITLGRLPTAYDSKTHSEAIRKGVLKEVTNTTYQGKHSLTVAGKACDCSEFVQQGVRWLSECNVQDEKITVVFAGAHGRLNDFYRWLSEMKSARVDAEPNRGSENPR